MGKGVSTFLLSYSETVPATPGLLLSLNASPSVLCRGKGHSELQGLLVIVITVLMILYS